MFLHQERLPGNNDLALESPLPGLERSGDMISLYASAHPCRLETALKKCQRAPNSIRALSSGQGDKRKKSDTEYKHLSLFASPSVTASGAALLLLLPDDHGSNLPHRIRFTPCRRPFIFPELCGYMLKFTRIEAMQKEFAMVGKKTLEELIERLPSDCQAEVQDFIEFLIDKHERKSGNRLLQNWAGALKEHRQHYSSVALQHQAAQWRIQ
ncbi:MAG TPA: DUF2281 domain-containing protein [Candidatus Hydrogenedentes bacterium]|jgi:hypothetical protein|nr:DUF2281 domain-containing protein [Candidatus Hydrogenedentota bacterium]